MNQFGELLRYYRRGSADPERGGALTQERLGKLLGEVLGDSGYTGAAVSDWERGKSQIDKDYRPVLIALIKVLYQAGGLRSQIEADTLLLSGNYRPLDANEKRQIFPEEGQQAPPGPGDPWRFTRMLWGERFLNPGDFIRQILPDRDGRPSDWSGPFVSLLGRFFSRWSAEGVLRAIGWIFVWFLAREMTFPLLRWPLTTQGAAREAVLRYAGAAVFLPFLIGLLANTRGSPFWKQQNLEKSPGLRFYTYIGAHMGFHIGYMMVFALGLAGYYLGLPRSPGWIASLGAVWPVLLGAASALEIPFNQWRAFGRLSFRDGAVLLIFVLFGPLFGVFFYAYHAWLLAPATGLPLILLAAGIVAAQTIFQRRRRHNSRA